MISYYADQFLDVVRREAAMAVAQREFQGTLVVTSFDPTKYAVKGIIMPHGVESNWIQVTGDHIGAGYGNLAGPKCGSADDLSGDQFALAYDRGDPNTIIATHRIFSDQDTPPQVQSGEILNQHQNGNRVYMKADNSIEVLGQNGSHVYIDPQGNQTHDAKGQTVTIQTSGQGNVTVQATGQGSVTVAGGQGGLSLSGSTIALTGVATLNGQPISTT